MVKALLAFYAGLLIGPFVYPVTLALPGWVSVVCLIAGLVLLLVESVKADAR